MGFFVWNFCYSILCKSKLIFDLREKWGEKYANRVPIAFFFSLAIHSNALHIHLDVPREKATIHNFTVRKLTLFKSGINNQDGKSEWMWTERERERKSEWERLSFACVSGLTINKSHCNGLHNKSAINFIYVGYSKCCSICRTRNEAAVLFDVPTNRKAALTHSFIRTRTRTHTERECVQAKSDKRTHTRCVLWVSSLFSTAIHAWSKHSVLPM